MKETLLGDPSSRLMRHISPRCLDMPGASTVHANPLVLFSRKSGDESDGMSSLSRKELCEAISHLKKKLDNAEKVRACNRLFSF